MDGSTNINSTGNPAQPLNYVALKFGECLMTIIEILAREDGSHNIQSRHGAARCGRMVT